MLEQQPRKTIPYRVAQDVFIVGIAIGFLFGAVLSAIIWAIWL